VRRCADRLADSLGALDRWARVELAGVPPDRRYLVTAHDAFAYFGRAYGFEVRGVQGLSTTAEAGLRDVQQLIDLLVARRIPALFVESSVPRRSVEAVLEGCRKRGHTCQLGGELHSDAPGQPPAHTYAGLFRHNVSTIARALGRVQP
jgi:manganese/zinc/iron transport system substrate-binding protein